MQRTILRSLMWSWNIILARYRETFPHFGLLKNIYESFLHKRTGGSIIFCILVFFAMSGRCTMAGGDFFSHIRYKTTLRGEQPGQQRNYEGHFFILFLIRWKKASVGDWHGLANLNGSFIPDENGGRLLQPSPLMQWWYCCCPIQIQIIQS